MLTPFVKILEKYRHDSFSEADKGSRFEELMREYLWNDPKYSIFFMGRKTCFIILQGAIIGDFICNYDCFGY
jgi:hypothetical protein